jgi:endo-1,4-beta-xylanase
LQLKPHKIPKTVKKYPSTICSPFTAIFMSSLISICAIGDDSTSQPTLKDTYKDDFKIGVAINQNQFTGEDPGGAAIIKTQFNSISPENVLKWESIQPRPGADGYNFGPGDQYVEFGEKNGMYIIGHTLVWHSQTPKWVFQGDGTNYCDRDTLLKRMHDHIQTVVGRYKGRIKCWDVVNEALQDNGQLRRSPWLKIIGEDYIAKAFEYAHEADPDAILRYNDYSLENEAKRKGAIALIKNLQARGIPVTAVGLQDHVKMDWPTVEQEDATISDFAKLGVKVMITELDVDLLSRNRSADVAEMQRQATSNIFTNGLPDSVQQALARRYADLFSVFLKHRNEISLVTFWGVTDGDSWLNRGRMNYPLLFDRNYQPKSAFDAVIGVAHQ